MPKQYNALVAVRKTPERDHTRYVTQMSWFVCAFSCALEAVADGDGTQGDVMHLYSDTIDPTPMAYFTALSRCLVIVFDEIGPDRTCEEGDIKPGRCYVSSILKQASDLAVGANKKKEEPWRRRKRRGS